MFSRSFVRGINAQLILNDRVSFPTEKMAEEVADYIADRVQIDPLNQVVSGEKVAEIANHLIDASNYLAQQGHRPNPAVKTATLRDLATLASESAVSVMIKAAESSNYEGGEKGNSEPESAEGKMDKADRPEGYAANSLAKSEVDVKPGAVGSEGDQPAKQKESPAGSNSITEARTASLSDMIRKKIAEGSTILGGDKGNKSDTSAEAKMDKGHRPDGYAVLPSQGTPSAINALVDAKAVVGKETKHPEGPHQTVSGSNSLIEHSQKAAAEDPFITLFKKVANEVAPHLPTNFTQEQKIASTRFCMGLTTEEKATYIADLHKTAGEMPAGLAAYMSGKGKSDGDSDDKKPEHKSEEKCKECGKSPCECKKEEKKEASAPEDLLAHLRKLASGVGLKA